MVNNDDRMKVEKEEDIDDQKEGGEKGARRKKRRGIRSLGRREVENEIMCRD